MIPSLADFAVLSFDCYGTLIDWESGIWAALRPLFLGTTHPRSEVLALFAELEAEEQAASPGLAYPEILKNVHRRLTDHLGVPANAELTSTFARSIGEWPAFPDSSAALRRLSGRFRLVILSNVDRRSFAQSNATLGVEFDAIYTAEDIGTYKPDPRNFEYLMRNVENDLGVPPNQLLHVAQSLYHDHLPARQLGLRTAWIDRQRLSKGGDWGATKVVDTPPEPDFTFFDLGELADSLSGD